MSSALQVRARSYLHRTETLQVCTAPLLQLCRSSKGLAPGSSKGIAVSLFTQRWRGQLSKSGHSSVIAENDGAMTSMVMCPMYPFFALWRQGLMVSPRLCLTIKQLNQELHQLQRQREADPCFFGPANRAGCMLMQVTFCRRWLPQLPIGGDAG